MAYKDQSSNQSNYEDTRRFNQPISNLFDMKHSLQHDWQGKGYSSRYSNTSIYKPGRYSRSFNESYQQSYQDRVNPPNERHYEEVERKIYQHSYQERVNPPFERDYETTERDSYQQSYQERVNPPFERDYETTERDSYQHFYQERVNPPFERDYETTERDSYQQSYQKSVNPQFEKNYQSTRYSPYKTSDQISFKSTSEGEFNSNFGNQRNVFRGNSYRGEFQSRRQKGRGNSAGKTHLVLKQEHNPKLLQCNENKPSSNEHNENKDNEFDCDEGGKQTTKINLINIDKALYEKYKFRPPESEVMGSIFKGMVIFYFYKHMQTRTEKNLFVVICESFRKSAQFDALQVEDGYQRGSKFRKFCTLRYNGMMMARGQSDNGNIKEARVCAAVELINKLAMTCYTLKAKETYFHGTDYSQYILETKEYPGLFRVVPEEEVPDVDSGLEYIKHFFNKEDSDCELVFVNPKMMYPMKSFAKTNPQFDTRILPLPLLGYNDLPISVFKRRTPQYWRDKILDSGKMENEKYTLTPPQGLGNYLLENFEINKAVPKLRYHPTTVSSDSKASLYDPKTAQKIVCAIPPWEKKSAGALSKNNKRKMKNIEKAIEEGQSLQSVKDFRFLKRNLKRKVMAKFGVPTGNVNKQVY